PAAPAGGVLGPAGTGPTTPRAALRGDRPDPPRARPPAFPVISPRTWPVENTPALAVNVFDAPSVSVAFGAVGVGYVLLPPPKRLAGLVRKKLASWSAAGSPTPGMACGFRRWMDSSFSR